MITLTTTIHGMSGDTDIVCQIENTPGAYAKLHDYFKIVSDASIIIDCERIEIKQDVAIRRAERMAQEQEATT